jgi:hypothetical protein
MEDRKQPTALYVLVIIAAVVCYGLGLGPACWWTSRFGGEKVVTVAYRPVTFVSEVIGSERLMEAIQSYSEFGANDSHFWTLSVDAPGHAKWGPLVFWDIDVIGGTSMEYPLAPEGPPESQSPP